MPKSRQRCVTSLSTLFERSGIEEQFHALARGELARAMLALETICAAAELGAPLEFAEEVASGFTYALTRLRFLPILQELLETDVRERMVEQLIDHGRRTGADIGAHSRGFDDVDGMTAAGDEDFGLEVVVLEDLHDLVDQIPCRWSPHRRVGRRRDSRKRRRPWPRAEPAPPRRPG